MEEVEERLAELRAQVERLKNRIDAGDKELETLEARVLEAEKSAAIAESMADNDAGMTAKKISKIFKFFAAFGIVLCAVFKWRGMMPTATVGEICMVWAVVYGLGAGTIDLNIMFDKFVGGGK